MHQEILPLGQPVAGKERTGANHLRTFTQTGRGKNVPIPRSHPDVERRSRQKEEIRGKQVLPPDDRN